MTVIDDDQRSLIAARTTALWAGIRFVVIDLETATPTDGGPRRAVAVAHVICRDGSVRAGSHYLINPGIPIDAKSQSIHHITDDHVAGEASFADLAHVILGAFESHAGEEPIVVAHNVGFDVSVLRTECALAGVELPELRTLDTMRLASHVGVSGRQPKLSELCELLGVINPRPHDAHADAVACAEVAVQLLQHAAAQGIEDFDQLLSAVSGGATTHTVKASTKTRSVTVRPAHVIPDTHLAGHANVLSPRAGVKLISAWRNDVIDCARYRCSHLNERVIEARPTRPAVLDALHSALSDIVDAGDTAGAATVVAALLPHLHHLPAGKGRLGFRTTALNWSKKWSPRLAALGRCSDDDLCPACQDGEPCPLDLVGDHLAQWALGDPDRYARGFFEMSGKEAGTGVYTSWLAARHDPGVADAAVQLCVAYWRSVGQHARGDSVAELAWKAGCRHPDVADSYAGQLAAPGREANFAAGINICTTTFKVRDSSTHEGWRRLQSRQAQLEGRRRRLEFKPSGKTDEDGNQIPVRIHHPTQPHRTRPARFLSG